MSENLEEDKKNTEKKEVEKKFIFEAKNIPKEPGCYLFYDKNEKLLYVGKAKNLRNRVSNYFQENKKNIKTKLLVSKIRDIKTQLVTSEIEALILENNLVKTHKPPFNILLRDDKNFMYLRVTNEDEPKLEIVRRVIKDGSRYFGPKTSAKSFRNTIRFCQKFFGAKMVKPGQDYYINQLMGKKISPEDYRKNIEDMKKFLAGNTQGVIKKLQEKMMNFAKDQNFEAAGKVRDTIVSIEGTTQKQNVEFTDLIDRDFIHFYREDKIIFMMCLAFRQGKLVNQLPLKFSVPEFAETPEILTQCLLQFYEKMTDFPREIYIPEKLENIEDLEVFEKLLSEKYFENKKVEIFIPQKGDKKKILDLTFKNAKNHARKSQIDEMSHQENFVKALPKLAEALDLKEPPKRMECYDISHFNGTHTVASMVVFVDGKPKNSEYKKFNIKRLEKNKIDDFASMNEVLDRRFSRILMAEEKERVRVELNTKSPQPPLSRGSYGNYYKKSHIPYLAELKENAQELRKNQTDSEKYFWKEILKSEEFQDLKFLRQKPLDKFIVDFFCSKLGIAIEIDGEIHDSQKDADRERTEILEEKFGILILRYSNDEVLNQTEKIKKEFIEEIKLREEFIKNTPSSPPDKGDLGGSKNSWEDYPDLIVIDGGKGQLSAVMKIFKDMKFDKKKFDPESQIISLAKREEEIFRPENPESIKLDFNNPALKLLQRIRDEAHRFAITANRSARGKQAQKSILDEIAGIGPSAKKKLMATFETISGIREASDEDLLKVISKKQLENLRRQI